ncbi:MAG: adenine deaminase [Chromatiales bacterium]|nr:adenine deaminase [Chromatiales bacterium]
MTSVNQGRIRINYIAIEQRRIFAAEVSWQAGKISAITEIGPEDPQLDYLAPGFIDAHIHIESSMLPPSEFGRLAVRHGTIGTVSDPHEIANVLGVPGVEFMLENARSTPFKAFFGAPSCVPATPFETANGDLGCAEIETLLQQPEVCCLSEMMNFPGVLARDPMVMAKIELALDKGYPVDGHAPGLKGEEARSYASAGITTDHECFTLQEARDKIEAGMSILIREGSAARNFDALHPLISERPDKVMLCSDDLHPDDLLHGHINLLLARATAAGHNLFDLLQVACFNPIDHYQLPLGKLAIGDPMDAVALSDHTNFTPKQVWIDGQLMAENGRSMLDYNQPERINHFDARRIEPNDLAIAPAETIRVIQVQDGSLVTRESQHSPKIDNGQIVPDLDNDILPICVINRYQPSKPAMGFIRGFGLTSGAIASSVAHDSHNVIAVGADHQAICAVANAVIAHQGGVAVTSNNGVDILPLPIAGIMSDGDGDKVGTHYAELDRQAKALGSNLHAPFMTLSFMALLVIPELKLSDKGLFDGRTFQFTDLVA